MFLVLVAYTALGALFFMFWEGGHQAREKLNVETARISFIKDTWEAAQKAQTFANFTIVSWSMKYKYDISLY